MSAEADSLTLAASAVADRADSLRSPLICSLAFVRVALRRDVVAAGRRLRYRLFGEMISGGAMARTVVSIPDDDKRWLDERAAEEGVAMTEIVRRAIRRYREELARRSFDELVEATRNTWAQGDGLEWQVRRRDEWDERTP
jgi:hypothetical protein